MKKLFYLITAAIVFVIASCEYKTIEQITIELPDEPISFSEQIQPIFTAKCITCHASVDPIMTEGSAFNNLISGGYVDPASGVESVLYAKISDGSHPGGNNNLSATELAMLLKWITDGAENN